MTRKKLTILTTLALGAAPAAAEAKVFCVGSASCADQKPTVAAALLAAAQNAGDDEVRIAAGVYDESVTYGPNALGRVTVTGAGRGQTTIKSEPKKAYVVDLERADVSDLAVQAIDAANNGPGGLRLAQGTARRLDVSSQEEEEAVKLGDGATLEDARVRSIGDYNTGVFASCPAGCTVRRLRIDSGIAIQTGDDARMIGEDLDARGAIGAGEGSVVTIRRALIAPEGVPIGAGAFGGELDLRQSTIVLPGGPRPGSIGAQVVPYDVTKLRRASSGSVLRLEGVVIDGFETPLDRPTGFEARGRADGNGARIIARGAAWDRSFESLRPGAGGLDFQGVVDLAGRAPAFRDPAAGDFRLNGGSPLIDKVPGAVPGDFRDLDGRPVADGDGDGVAAADIGAYEAGAVPLRVTAPPVTPPAAGPAVVAPTQRAAVTDRTRPRLSGLRLVRGKLLAKLSEQATLKVVVQRKRGKRFVRVGKATSLVAKADANRLSVRLPKKAGRYRLVVTAIDAAGNASAAQRLTVRVR